MKKSALPVFLAITLLLSILAVPSGAQVDLPPPLAPERVGAEEIGVDASQTDVPWRAGIREDGSPWIVYGDVTAFDVPPDLRKIAEGVGPDESVSKRQVTAAAKALSWSCLVLPAYTTTLSSGWLKGTLDITCTGTYKRHRARWRHERSSWSHWRNYSDMTYTAWISGNELLTPIYSRCNSSGGRYNYRSEFYHQIEVKTGDTRTSPYYHGTASTTKYKCGTREI